jgi:LDH2 family malate/lactate/ureidoglycolate dehydrogenase
MRSMALGKAQHIGGHGFLLLVDAVQQVQRGRIQPRHAARAALRAGAGIHT